MVQSQRRFLWTEKLTIHSQKVLITVCAKVHLKPFQTQRKNSIDTFSELHMYLFPHRTSNIISLSIFIVVQNINKRLSSFLWWLVSAHVANLSTVNYSFRLIRLCEPFLLLLKRIVQHHRLWSSLQSSFLFVVFLTVRTAAMLESRAFAGSTADPARILRSLQEEVNRN